MKVFDSLVRKYPWLVVTITFLICPIVFVYLHHITHPPISNQQYIDLVFVKAQIDHNCNQIYIEKIINESTLPPALILNVCGKIRSYRWVGRLGYVDTTGGQNIK